MKKEVESFEQKRTGTEAKMRENPGEEDTNNLLTEIRNGLRNLRTKIEKQNEEINSQVPLIEEITHTGKKATCGADGIIKNLKKM